MSCPDENELALLGEAALDDAARAALEAHIDRCATCDALVRELAGLVAAGTTDEEVPTVPPRYRLLRRLGSGGMGVVWEAEDRELGRKVAIKVARRTGDASLRARLVREARMIAGVRHRNIVLVYDVGEYADQPYVSMELVEGVTARRWRAAAARSMPEILDVWCAAAAGLHALHQQDIVHRDVKPENVIVAEDGRVVVCDLGLATDLGARTLTRTGHAVGTLAYMAPEQARGDDVDARADVYAWTVATWEAVTGRHPFADRESADPSRVPGARGAVLAILGAGIAQPRAERPALDVLVARLAAARTLDGGRPGSPRARRAAVGVGLAASLIALGGGLWHLAGPANDALVPRERPQRLASRLDPAASAGAPGDAEDPDDAGAPGALPISRPDAALAVRPAHPSDAGRTIAVPRATQPTAVSIGTGGVATVDAGMLPEVTGAAYQRYGVLMAQVTRAEAAIAAGDAGCRAIVAAFPPVAPELGTAIAERVALAGPRCEMATGDCAGGEQHLAARLRASGAPEDAIVRAVDEADVTVCPIAGPGTPAQRMARVQWRTILANASSQPCAAVVDAAEAANVKSPMLAPGFATCLARAGQCDRAARYLASDAERAELLHLFPSCKP